MEKPYAQDAIDSAISAQLQYCPSANEDVLRFIYEFTYHACFRGENLSDHAEKMHIQFAAGYCYYFAHMLKLAFGRGEVCIAAPVGHIVWVDDAEHDSIPYDIDGVNYSDCECYIPESYMGDAVKDFKHVTEQSFGATKEFINNMIAQYKEDMKNAGNAD